MPSPKAPSMPTKKQVQEIAQIVRSLHPNARISRIGPEGVTFAYPDSGSLDVETWKGRPFTAEEP